ncbi:MAG: SdrD B-like domain-containing protein, partial [Rubripirellula sp.]
VNASDTSNLFLTDTLSINSAGFGEMDVVGADRAYLAVGDGGLVVVDIPDPTNLLELGRFNTPGSAVDVDTDGTIAYVADATGGLRILDISDPANIVELGSTNLVTPEAVLVEGTIAYVAGGGALTLLDVSDPANIRVIDSETIPAADASQLSLEAEGSRIYLATTGGLRIYDGNGLSVGTIVNDDTIAATLTVSDPSVSEISSADQSVTVTLDNAVPGGFTVDFAAMDGTAGAPGDYVLNPGTLTFAGTAGETQTIPFTVGVDNQTEPNEQFTIGLSNLQTTGGTPATAINATDIGTVTIIDGRTSADLVTTITSNVGSVSVGGNVTYAVNVLNNGGGLATLVDSTTLIPAGLTIVNAVAGTGANAVINGNQVIAGASTLAVGASFTVTINAMAGTIPGSVTVATSVTTTADDPVPANNADSINTLIETPLSSSISGRVYNDANNNGLVDAGEMGIPNVLVTLGGTATATALTDANGDYSFLNLQAGTYTVTETQPIGFDDGIDTLGLGATATLAPDAFTDLVLLAGANATGFNFGERVPVVAMLSGEVFCDDNNSNTHDRPEESVVGTLVFIDANNNGRFDSGERSTLTDASGGYSFDSVTGSINVSVVVPVSCNTITEEPGIRRTIVPVGNLARSIAAVNINPSVDSDIDLVAVGDLSGTLTVVENTPSGFVAGATHLVGQRPQSVFVHQESPLSAPTIAVASIGTPANGGAVFTTNGISSPVQHGASSGPIDVVVDHFDGDQTLDVLSASFRDSLLQLRLGASGETVTIDSEVEQILSIASGNLTGTEMSREVVVSGFGYGSGQNKLEVYEMDSSGEPVVADTIDVANSTVEVAAHDVIRNSLDFFDEIITLQSTGSIVVYPMLSNGTIGTGIVTQVSEGATAFDFGDFNKDGVADVAVANLGNQLIELYSGTGDGRFALITTIRNVSAPSDIVVADVNDDGFDDIAVSNFYTDVNISDPLLPPQYRLESTVTILQLEIASRDVIVTANAIEDFRFPTADAEILLDTSGDNQVTAVDALRVINVLNRQSLAEGEQIQTRAATDVNGDGVTSAVDAVMIINYLSRDSVAEGSEVSIDDLIPNDDDRDDQIASVDEVLTAGLF